MRKGILGGDNDVLEEIAQCIDITEGLHNTARARHQAVGKWLRVRLHKIKLNKLEQFARFFVTHSRKTAYLRAESQEPKPIQFEIYLWK